MRLPHALQNAALSTKPVILSVLVLVLKHTLTCKTQKYRKKKNARNKIETTQCYRPEKPALPS